MCKWMLMLLVASCARADCYDDRLKPLLAVRQNQNKKRQLLSLPLYPSLQNYEYHANPVSESMYPWIARLKHTSAHVCTAICLERRVFATAARCIYSLKAAFTRIVYQQYEFETVALVLPSTFTKQAFDDIGFVVVKDEGFNGNWITIEVFSRVQRTDNSFQWFSDLDLNAPHKVLGYAAQKYYHLINGPNKEYRLSELDVVVSTQLCSEILTLGRMDGFHVPCYLPCTLDEFRENNKQDKCKRYHGVEGGAIINTNTRELLGVVTWGAQFGKYELPVGFSVPNSDTFYEDFECAKRIARDVSNDEINGYYQDLCTRVSM